MCGNRITTPFLSKSGFLAGLQCPLRLWYLLYEPALASEPLPFQKALFDTGWSIGELARERQKRGQVIEDVEMLPPGPGEVRIAVKVCGVCGSDTHAFQGLHPFVEAPIVLGHEFAGQIDALGQGVSGLSVGQRVTVGVSLVCGRCDMCREGRYNIWDHLRVLGCQADGAMGEMVNVAATKVVPIPHGMSYESAALV